mgnify:CR=1 FL=1
MPIKKLLILNKNRKVKTMGKMKKEKVLIAMSGGVDSSVAAYMMKKNGDRKSTRLNSSHW